MPLISVIVPVYNVEPYIRRCIDSILSQTFTDFELILIDDGSPDNCPDICDEYAQKDDRVYVIHQENQGLSAARNAGLDHILSTSDSEWATFIDSDDWVLPRYLEYLYKEAKENDTSVSLCTYKEVTDFETTDYSEKCASRLVSPEEYYAEARVNATTAWAKLYNKRHFLTLRYPVGKIREDEFVTYRILFSEKKIAVIDLPLYMYFQNDNGIMRSGWNIKHLAANQAFKEQLEFFKKNGYKRAYDAVIPSYLSSLMVSIDGLNKMGDAEQLKKEQLSDLRKLLLENLFNKTVTDSKYYTWYLDTAFPKLMNVYWVAKAQLNKLKKH